MKSLRLLCNLSLAIGVAAIIGCGGGSATGTTSGNGGTFTLGAAMKINGGSTVGTLNPGTQTLVLSDGQGNATTFANVLVPSPLTSGLITVIRSGSHLFNGTFSGPTAQCISTVTGLQGAVPLNSDGSLAQDTAIDTNSYLQMPITANGGLTFQNGVQVTADASGIGNNTNDVTLTLTTSAVSIPPAGQLGNASGSLSFSGGGTANTVALLKIVCADNSDTSVLGFAAQTNAPSKTASLTGQFTGSNFTSNKVSYQILL